MGFCAAAFAPAPGADPVAMGAGTIIGACAGGMICGRCEAAACGDWALIAA